MRTYAHNMRYFNDIRNYAWNSFMHTCELAEHWIPLLILFKSIDAIISLVCTLMNVKKENSWTEGTQQKPKFFDGKKKDGKKIQYWSVDSYAYEMAQN